MNKLDLKSYTIVETMTRYNIDLTKTSVKDLISQALDFLVPFLQNFNANITKIESLSKEEQDVIFKNWEQANIELQKAFENIKNKANQDKEEG